MSQIASRIGVGIHRRIGRLVQGGQPGLTRGDDQRRHLLHAHEQIDRARGDGTVRHAGILGHGSVAALRQGQAAAGLDRLQAKRAIMAGAGQNDADRILAQIMRHRVEKRVDRGGFPRRIEWYLTQ